MAHFIIHIGYGKTGTTAIQTLLSNNRKWLVNKGILYPDLKHKGTWLNLVNHNYFAFALSGKKGWLKLEPLDYLNQFESQLKKLPGVKRILLSGEDFAGGIQPWEFGSQEEYTRAVTYKIQYLKDLLSNHKVSVLVYLRRQDTFLESAIDQAIKNESLFGRQLFRTVPEFVKVMRPRLDYYAALNIWASIFGRENVKVAVYEKEQFHNGRLFDDYLARLGITDLEGLVVPKNNARVDNKRFTRDVAEFKRILNRIPKPKHEERLLMMALQEISEDMSNTEPVDFSFLSLAERQDILSEFESSNQYVAKNYLGRNDGKLFLEPVPDISDVKSELLYPGLSVEKAMEIMLRLQRKMESWQWRFERFRLWMAKLLRIRAPFLHALVRPIIRRF